MAMRNLRGYYVTGEMLASILRMGTRTLSVGSCLPETARFHSACFDFRRNCFVVYFHDESFDKIMEGAPIPLCSSNCVVTEMVLESTDA